MFRPHGKITKNTVTIDVEGDAFAVPTDMTVAAAVMTHGGKDHIRRAPVNGEKRAPFCFMGVCHECLMEIDGVPDQQACLIQVRDGMKIKRQIGPPKVD